MHDTNYLFFYRVYNHSYTFQGTLSDESEILVSMISNLMHTNIHFFFLTFLLILVCLKEANKITLIFPNLKHVSHYTKLNQVLES